MKPSGRLSTYMPLRVILPLPGPYPNCSNLHALVGMEQHLEFAQCLIQNSTYPKLLANINVALDISRTDVQKSQEIHLTQSDFFSPAHPMQQFQSMVNPIQDEKLMCRRQRDQLYTLQYMVTNISQSYIDI